MVDIKNLSTLPLSY